MDKEAVMPVGAFVIISFLLMGLIVMGCMLYWNWSHRKQHAADIADNISNGNACIYEKNNPRRPVYNRSSNGIITQQTKFIYSLYISLRQYKYLLLSIITLHENSYFSYLIALLFCSASSCFKLTFLFLSFYFLLFSQLR